MAKFEVKTLVVTNKFIQQLEFSENVEDIYGKSNNYLIKNKQQ